ncbi:MAG TPA: tripartite tricarboxylate transporter TctB family protein [Chloroflexota bacterium]|nr:tripartite tricarboxylate transporter TctB family protein [Chloroflexota bacterium]
MSFDRGLSIGLFLFSSWALYLSITMPKTAIRQTVGPEVFPIVISFCMILAAVALFVKTVREKATKVRHSELPEGVGEDRLTQGLALLGIGVYIFAMEPLGYIVSTALLCIYETAVFETGHWVRNVASGVGFSVVVYATFVSFLDVMLPKGILGW